MILICLLLAGCAKSGGKSEQITDIRQLDGQAVAIMTALNVILEFLATASDPFCLQMVLTDLGGSLEMLNTDALRSRT